MMSGLDALSAALLPGIDPAGLMLKVEESITNSGLGSPTSDVSSLSHAPQLASTMPTPYGSYSLADMGASSQDTQDVSPSAMSSGVRYPPPLPNYAPTGSPTQIPAPAAAPGPYTQQQKRPYSSSSGPSSVMGTPVNSGPPAKKRPTSSRQSTADKSGKGLRHFSLKVCQKVKSKGITTYNEVAEELVQELANVEAPTVRRGGKEMYDQKNIRRRVYDALNVLMAMDIIEKKKKDIRWIGLPTNAAQEHMQLQDDKRRVEERIITKRERLHELILQQLAFKNLISRNGELERTRERPDPSRIIQLPYIIINTVSDNEIECEMAEDGTEYFLEFDQPFDIQDEIEVLKRMDMALGLDKGECSPEALNMARNMIPPPCIPHLEELAGLRPECATIDMEEVHRNARAKHAQKLAAAQAAAEAAVQSSTPNPTLPPPLTPH